MGIDPLYPDPCSKKVNYDYHYMGNAEAQNSAVGYPDIKAVMNGWHNSSGHRINMQNRNSNCMGIHKMGRYWTQNFRNEKSDCQ